MEAIKKKVQNTLDIIGKEAELAGSAILTFEEISELTGTSLRTAKNHIKELEEKGYLFVDRFVTSDGQFPNEYSLTPFREEGSGRMVTLKSLIDFDEEDAFWNGFAGQYEPIQTNTKTEAI